MQYVSEIPAEMLAQLMKRGKKFVPALKPADIQRGPIGWCFDYSIINALQTRYEYVEGVAKSTPESPWRLHAWLTDGVHAFDPTWYAEDRDGQERVIPGEYRGIVMDKRKVAEFMQETEYQSILANGWRAPELALAIHGNDRLAYLRMNTLPAGYPHEDVKNKLTSA